MKANSLFFPLRLLVAAALLHESASALSQAAPKCDEIANDVRKAVTADPSKTLMIVEDALVISENCACEIVKAAIEASRADSVMKQQIVQTALAVAPKMAGVITECAGVGGAVPVAYEESATTDPTDSGKNPKYAKEVLPIMPEPVEDYTYFPRDIRGVYLIAPGGVGIVDDRSVEKVCSDDKDDDDKPRRRITRPISRSVAANR